MALIPAMAHATTHLGFGVTCNLVYEPPFLFARRMATLDHLTNGRIGWNIVTGALDSAARAMGLREQMAHDDRYDLADEYMRVAYALWEGGWRDDAVVRDRSRDVHWSDPTSVPNPTGLDGYAMKANSTVWMRFRCGSRRRNEPRFCIRQAGPRAAAYSPHATLSAYSFTAEI
jgi:alkanesulfonate monooxygenase SsuD/methylene tetrahydromethanopterin reductase-like flavin-dependent oxidoreductase (luciferase family)